MYSISRVPKTDEELEKERQSKGALKIEKDVLSLQFYLEKEKVFHIQFPTPVEKFYVSEGENFVVGFVSQTF